MQEREILRVLNISSFTRHPTPFKYLGIPICAKRISVDECTGLVQKVVARIKVWSSRNISFAGRVVLMNSVLLTIHTFLPKKIIYEIKKVCSNFLWKQGLVEGPNSVASGNLCRKNAVGGLGFVNTSDWNEAVLFKHVWSIANKKDNHWIKWVHSVYIKNEEWLEHKAPLNSSWYWRKIDEANCKIGAGYKLLQRAFQHPFWHKEISRFVFHV
uniref:Uncharacterized protein n=1 Tax=Cannabis sativa TaxID=3483 RepID=A0A803QSK2_CANSA